MNFLSSLTKKDLINKTCLLRVDLNLTGAEISEGVSARRVGRQGITWKIHPRIIGILPTINFLIDRGAKIVILSHRGRLEGKSKINPPAGGQKSKVQFKNQNFNKFSLKPFVKILSSLLKIPVHFIDFNIGKSDLPKLSSILRRSDFQKSGNVFLLENLRFFSGEEKNDDKFSKKLASLGDFYVDDAFAVSHRANASVSGITKYLPSYAGLLMEKEIKNLDKAAKNPKKPLVIILGGAKISDKIGLIKDFFKKADYFLIGGGISNTFLVAQGLPVGDSLYNKNTDVCRLINRLTQIKAGLEKKIILPIDTAVYRRQILDIGPNTIEKYSEIIKNAKTIIWNGPMGYIEDKRFRKGSEAIAKAIVKSKAFSIIGGGETVSLLRNTRNYAEQYAELRGKNQRLFISTGGGAMLEYLAGKKLPGIEALK